MDARRRPRTPYRGWVELSCEGQRARTAGVDLSVDGLGLALPEAGIPVEGALVSEFALPGITLPVELQGHWAWADPAARRGGIRFESVDPGIADLLENFVAGRL